MTDPFANRESYRSLVSGEGLSYFRVTFKESDLLIGAEPITSVPATAVTTPDTSASPGLTVSSVPLAFSSLEEVALCAIQETREVIEDQIAVRPEFQSSLVPLSPLGKEPEPILRMLQAGRIAGTGPMAAVAGLVAATVGTALRPWSPEVIVENGGDIFLIGPTPRTVAIAAGKSPLSMKLGLALDPSCGIGICTSSGTYGHSLSFGKSDAAVVVAPDCALADAVATMLGNRCGTIHDLGPAVEWAAALPGIAGALAIMDDHLAVAGDLELVQLT